MGMTRTAVALVGATMLLVSCSGGGSEPELESYASIVDMGEALQDAGIGCGDLVDTEPPEDADAGERLPSEAGTCGDVQLFLFEDENARDKWLTLGSSFGNVVTGPNWTVIAPDEDTADEIADALGGET